MLHLYNSLSKKKQVFKPLKKGTVTMYNCGPTVYDFAHIGNLRSFLFADLLRRYLEYSGRKVKQVMNITDVGHMLEDADEGLDKIEQAAKKAKKSPKQIADFYTKAFFRDIDKLDIKRAWKYPKATDHIKEMIRIIEKLIKKGYAYEVGGSVYFDLSKFKKYGKLSGNKMKDLIAGARVDVNPDKKNPYDFALWIHNPKHKMQWNSPWGKGHPGWHIECSAMAEKYLGKTIDIHTGGEDNKFPHHECEIAQSECANGQEFSKFWLHTKHLLVNGKKMSKSKGNFYTLDDLLGNKKTKPLTRGRVRGGYSARAIRYLLIFTHYRDQLNFTFKGLDDAESALKRLDEVYTRLMISARRNAPRRVSTKSTIHNARKDFKRAMDDDLNVSKALAVVFGFVKKINKIVVAHCHVPSDDRKSTLRLLKEFDSVFGFNLQKIKTGQIPKNILKLVKEREKARKEKDWKKADKIRKQIEKKGHRVEDTTKGSVVHPVK